MTKSIAIHVDSYYGLVEGVPNLLKILKRYDIKATFFVNMGNESNIFEILKYKIGSSSKRYENFYTGALVKRYSKKQLLSMVLLNRGIGHKHPEILRLIESEGHELQPHCWSHIKWSKEFDSLDKLEQINKMRQAYFSCIGMQPIGFVPPTWKIDDDVLSLLKYSGFKYVSISEGKTPYKYKGLILIPLSFGKNIEELLNEGKTREEILDIYDREIRKDFVNLYFHADFEGINGSILFEDVLKLLKGLKTTRYKEILEGS